MERQRPRTSMSAVALALALVFAGCSGAPISPDDLSAEEIGERAQEKYESIDSYEGTLTSSVASANVNRTTTANVWVRPHSNELRYEYVSSGPMNGTVMVSNGSVMWSYNESANTVRKTDISGLGSGVAATNYSSVFENAFERYDISHEGSATVGDRSTYVIELTPKNGSSTVAIEEWTLWIDKDRWFPVKHEMTTSIDDETSTTTVEYTNLSFNTDVPDDTFEFEPPADATVEQTRVPDVEQYESVDGIDAATSFDVVEPSELPDGYEFTRAVRSNSSESRSATLTYENESDALVVRQFTGNLSGTDADETVTVNGHEASVTTYGETTSLSWTCDGRSYSVIGSLPTDELTDVASSLDCE